MWFINNKKLEMDLIKDRIKSLENDVAFLMENNKELLESNKRLERILKYGKVGYYFPTISFVEIGYGGVPVFKEKCYFYKDNKEYEIESLPFLMFNYTVKNIKFVDNNVFLKVLIGEEIKSYIIDLNKKIFIEMNWEEI